MGALCSAGAQSPSTPTPNTQKAIVSSDVDRKKQFRRAATPHHILPATPSTSDTKGGGGGDTTPKRKKPHPKKQGTKKLANSSSISASVSGNNKSKGSRPSRSYSSASSSTTTSDRNATRKPLKKTGAPKKEAAPSPSPKITRQAIQQAMGPNYDPKSSTQSNKPSLGSAASNPVHRSRSYHSRSASVGMSPSPSLRRGSRLGRTKLRAGRAAKNLKRASRPLNLPTDFGNNGKSQLYNGSSVNHNERRRHSYIVPMSETEPFRHISAPKVLADLSKLRHLLSELQCADGSSIHTHIHNSYTAEQSFGALAALLMHLSPRPSAFHQSTVTLYQRHNSSIAYEYEASLTTSSLIVGGLTPASSNGQRRRSESACLLFTTPLPEDNSDDQDYGDEEVTASLVTSTEEQEGDDRPLPVFTQPTLGGYTDESALLKNQILRLMRVHIQNIVFHCTQSNSPIDETVRDSVVNREEKEEDCEEKKEIVINGSSIASVAAIKMSDSVLQLSEFDEKISYLIWDALDSCELPHFIHDLSYINQVISIGYECGLSFTRLKDIVSNPQRKMSKKKLPMFTSKFRLFHIMFDDSSVVSSARDIGFIADFLQLLEYFPSISDFGTVGVGRNKKIGNKFKFLDSNLVCPPPQPMLHTLMRCGCNPFANSLVTRFMKTHVQPNMHNKDSLPEIMLEEFVLLLYTWKNVCAEIRYITSLRFYNASVVASKSARNVLQRCTNGKNKKERRHSHHAIVWKTICEYAFDFVTVGRLDKFLTGKQQTNISILVHCAIEPLFKRCGVGSNFYSFRGRQSNQFIVVNTAKYYPVMFKKFTNTQKFLELAIDHRKYDLVSSFAPFMFANNVLLSQKEQLQLVTHLVKLMSQIYNGEFENMFQSQPQPPLNDTYGAQEASIAKQALLASQEETLRQMLTYLSPTLWMAINAKNRHILKNTAEIQSFLSSELIQYSANKLSHYTT